jgi:hypothetical protein
MAAVMIKCPVTPHSFCTGLDVDSDEAFHALLDVAYHTDCPLCGNNHVWFKQNAWIADSFEPRQEGVSHCKSAAVQLTAAR